MYQLLVSDESRLDIMEAYSWYEDLRSGLGEEFELCLETGFEFIAREPLLCQIRYRKLRIHFIERFPYGIHYLIDGNAVKVFGIFHTSKDPSRWHIRIYPTKT